MLFSVFCLLLVHPGTPSLGHSKKDRVHHTSGRLAADENRLVAYGFPNVSEFLLAAAGDPPTAEGPLAVAIWYEAQRLTLLAFNQMETSDAKH